MTARSDRPKRARHFADTRDRAGALYRGGDRGLYLDASPRDFPATSFWYALESAEQHEFRRLADERRFAGGAALMIEGERADYVVVILAGRVKVCVSEGGTERIIALRGPGQLVGERAILQVSERSATVVALELVSALVMRKEDFARFVSLHPDVLGIVEGQIYQRLREDGVRSEQGLTGRRQHDRRAAHHRARVALSAGRVLAVAARLQPAPDRARYAAEFGSELWELAQAGAGRWGQLRYAARQLREACQLRAALRAPRRRGAVP